MQHEYGMNFDNCVAATDHAPTRFIAGSCGFTLMELMVTIAIIGILAAIATPNAIAWRNNAQFNAAVREVKSVIEGTRVTAIRTNLPATVTFNGTRNFTTQTQEMVAGGVVAPSTVVNHQLGPGITVKAKTGGILTFNNRGMASNMTVTVDGYGLSRDIVISILGSSRVD